MYRYSIIFILTCVSCLAQPSLEDVLSKFNEETIPYISVTELAKVTKETILLDAREKGEFNVSHIQGAYHVGYDRFSLKKVIRNIPDKKAFIVVYCSLGVRSEDIAEKLKQAGYSSVFNLYGGIFEWKNQGYKVVDSKGTPTDKIHAFSKIWSLYLKKGIKVYE